MSRKRKNKSRHQFVWSGPDFNNPVCPTCGKADQIVDEAGDDNADDPMFECTRCWVRFMYEDSSPETEDNDIEANINMGAPAAHIVKLKCAICLGKGCEVCKPKKKNTKEYQTEPIFGEMEELTDAVPR